MAKDSYNPKDKFGWKKGDMKVDLPQCHNCERNMGPTQCEIYGDKPTDIVENKEKCPYKVIEI